MRTVLLFLAFLSGLSVCAQPAGYAVFNRAFTIDGATGIAHMNEAPGEGIAWIDDSTFEAVYFRPFNFRSADPARVLHAVQYVAPIVHRPGRKIGYWVGNGSAGDWKKLHLTTKK